MEEILTKVKINGYLNNITDNIKENFNLTGIKSKNNISYIHRYTKYKLKIFSMEKVILQRENSEMKHIFIFEKGKTNDSIYYMKENGLNLEIEIQTLSIEIEENIIKICYIVKETNTKYEYKIEMSEE